MSSQGTLDGRVGTDVVRDDIAFLGAGRLHCRRWRSAVRGSSEL